MIYPFFSKKPQEFVPDSIQRILVIRLDHIGDVIMTRPPIQALVEAFPQAKIDLMVSEEIAPLFSLEPGLNKVISVTHHWFSREGSLSTKYGDFGKLAENLEHERYDLGIDFRGDARNILLMERAHIPFRLSYPVTGGKFLLTHVGDYDAKVHQIDLNLRLLEKIGVHTAPQTTKLNYAPEKKEHLQKELDFLRDSKAFRILIHMGAGYPSKCWPIDHYRSLISTFVKRKNFQIILIGTKTEKMDMPVVSYPGAVFDLRGRLSLEELPIIIDLADAYLGNDSGPAHLAAAQGIRGLVLFSGANEARVWAPRSENLKIITKSVPCSPCEAKICPLKHHDCMELISLEEVIQGLDEIIASQKLGRS